MQIRTNFADAIIDALFKVNERIRAPDVLANLLASYHFAGALEQERQNLGGLMFQAKTHTTPRQYSVRAKLIISERQYFPWLGSIRQSTPHFERSSKGRFRHSSAESSHSQQVTRQRRGVPHYRIGGILL